MRDPFAVERAIRLALKHKGEATGDGRKALPERLLIEILQGEGLGELDILEGIASMRAFRTLEAVEYDRPSPAQFVGEQVEYVRESGLALPVEEPTVAQTIAILLKSERSPFRLIADAIGSQQEPSSVAPSTADFPGSLNHIQATAEYHRQQYGDQAQEAAPSVAPAQANDTAREEQPAEEELKPWQDKKAHRDARIECLIRATPEARGWKNKEVAAEIRVDASQISRSPFWKKIQELKVEEFEAWLRQELKL